MLNKDILSVFWNCSCNNLAQSVGSVRVQSAKNYESEDTNIMEMTSITYDCCQNVVNSEKLEKLKPLKNKQLIFDKLNVAEHKINEYSDQLNEIINRPSIERKFHWFIILCIVLIPILIIIFFIKCRKRTKIFSSIMCTRPGSSSSNNVREPKRNVLPKLILKRRT